VGLPLRPGIVHRLDRDTSGVMVVARTEAAHLPPGAAVLEPIRVDRRYWALAWDHKLPDAGTDFDGLYGRHPTDRVRVQWSRDRAANRRRRTSGSSSACHRSHWLECRLDTGRTHQIRVHLSELGSPLVGDETYGGRRRIDRPEALRRLGPELGLLRQFLHALRLGFVHPTTGARLLFESPLPDDLMAVLTLLRATINGPAPVDGAAPP
jgi:23S rRNA pseudouridine1911/1915/1917 synthase